MLNENQYERDLGMEERKKRHTMLITEFVEHFKVLGNKPGTYDHRWGSETVGDLILHQAKTAEYPIRSLRLFYPIGVMLPRKPGKPKENVREYADESSTVVYPLSKFSGKPDFFEKCSTWNV